MKIVYLTEILNRIDINKNIVYKNLTDKLINFTFNTSYNNLINSITFRNINFNIVKYDFDSQNIKLINLYFTKCVIKQTLILSYIFNFNDCIIRNGKGYNGNIVFNTFEIKTIQITSIYDIKYSKINIINNIKLDNLLIDNIEVGELILENINNNFESFEIRNCKIDKLVIRNSNLGKAVFNGLTIKQLEIQNATLNDCIFNGVDFKTYELEIISNKYLEIEKIKKHKNKTDISIVKNIDYKCMKDNYRQLKHVMDKNGNHTEANKFFTLEMEQYSKLDNLTGYEKLSLFVQKTISNYGNNWLKAFCTIIGFAFFSTLYNQFHLWLFHDYLMDLKYFLVVFINLLNPFFGFSKGIYDSLKEYPAIYFGFVVYKIIYAILVYQLIIALKRTTRR